VRPPAGAPDVNLLMLHLVLSRVHTLFVILVYSSPLCIKLRPILDPLEMGVINAFLDRLNVELPSILL